MEQKFYAPVHRHWLTITDHEGQSNQIDIAWNIMRMMVMSEEDVTAKEAIEILDEMPMPEFNDLKDRAYAELYDPQMQAYLERKGLQQEDRLLPVADEVEMLDYLDEMDWEGFRLWELPEVEWD